jgi:hypothetical protein
MCKSIQPLAEASRLSVYTPVEYTFQLKAPYAKAIDADGLWDSFKLRILNQGIRGYWDNSGTPTLGNICTTDSSGNFVPVTTDVRLNRTGIPMDSTLTIDGNTPTSAPGTFPANIAIDPMPPAPSTAIAYLLKYTKKLPVDFGPLNL